MSEPTPNIPAAEQSPDDTATYRTRKYLRSIRAAGEFARAEEQRIRATLDALTPARREELIDKAIKILGERLPQLAGFYKHKRDSIVVLTEAAALAVYHTAKEAAAAEMP